MVQSHLADVSCISRNWRHGEERGKIALAACELLIFLGGASGHAFHPNRRRFWAFFYSNVCLVKVTINTKYIGTSNELDVQNEWEEKTHTLNKYIIIGNDGCAVASLLVYHYDKSYDSQRTDTIETHHTYYLL